MLGVAKLFRAPVAIGLLVLGVALATTLLIENLRHRVRTERQESKRKIFNYAAWALIGIPLVCAFVAALAPATGKDALVYRLVLPQSYVAAGSFVDTPRNVYSFLALGAEMNGVWAMLIGKVINAHVAEVAFCVLAFAYFPLLVMLVYGWARESKLSHASALAAAAMVAGIPTIYQVAASGYADHVLAIYLALGIRAASRWWSTLNHRWLVTIALALGFALTIKLIAIFICLPLLLMFLLKARNAQQQCSEKSNAILLNGMLALVCAGMLASPWYIRTWMKTGNPVYPFYVNVLGGSAEGWDSERSQLFQIFLSRYGGESKSVLDYVIAPVKLSLQAHPEI
ncbi:MAG TPA: phospholipid carrier-dependent glycosyltransferase, partial [Blastocatellia bacterium]|nr:phospholipid carrier-dependent glycosyltransferase [Blastocatellia bacterium]